MMKGRILAATIINKFKEHLVLEERSAATIEKHMRDVKAFSAFVNGVCRFTIDVLQRSKIKDDEWKILCYS